MVVASPGAPTAGRKRRSRAGRRVEPYAWLIPATLMLSLVFLIPEITAFLDSFTNAKLIGGGAPAWVGLRNYAPLISPDFLIVLGRTVFWVVISVGGAVICGFLLAVLLDKPIAGRTLFRIIVVLPWIFPESLVAVMWKWTLHPAYGMLNNALIAAGIVDEGVNFFSTSTALATCLAVNIWRLTPFIFLAALAALQAVPEDIEQAARIDGASPFQILRRIKLPMVAPVLWTSAVILSAWTLVNFDLIFVLTGGGPNRVTEVIGISIYRAGFQRFDLGLASAMASATILVVMVFGYFYVKATVKDAR
jgi:multiple sugar transport system permease protein